MASGRSGLTSLATWFAAVVLVAGLTVGSIALSTPGGGSAQLEKLVPGTLGATSVYRTTTNGKPTGLHVEQITGSALLGPDHPAVVAQAHYEDFLGKGPFDVTSYDGQGRGQLLEYGIRLRGQYHQDTPPLPLLQLPLAQHRTWTWRGTALEQKAIATFTVVGIEELRVAGEERTGCAHIREVELGPKGSRDVFDSWYCPDLGLARDEGRFADGTTFSEGMVSYRAPGLELGASQPQTGENQASGDTSTDPGHTAGLDEGRTNFVPNARLDAGHLAWTEARKGDILYPPVGGSGLSIVAENDGTVSALDARTGAVRWQVQLDGPIVASPVVAGPVVLVADASRALFAFDIQSGFTTWAEHFHDLVSATPLVSSGTVVVPVEDRTVRGLRLSNGKQFWEAETKNLVKTSPAAVRDTAVLTDAGGTVTAISLEDGSTKWTEGLDGVLGAGPVATDRIVIAANDGGTIFGFDPESGALLWRVHAKDNVDVAPAVAGDTAVVVAGRYVEGLSTKDGRELWRTGMDSEIGTPPVVLGNDVIALGIDATMEILSLSTGRPGKTVDIPSPQPNLSIDTELPMGYVDGALVIPVHSASDWPFTILMAYPAPTGGSAASPSGVRLEGEVRAVPSSPIAAPGLAGNSLVLAGTFEHAAWAIPPRGGPHLLVRSDDLVPFAVPAGDLVLTQQGQDLVAIPVSGGTPAWRFHIGPPQVGAQPLVVGETAVVPLAGGGLVGLELRTGIVRWPAEVPVIFASTPAPLSQGLVAYAGRGVAIVDSLTGRIVAFQRAITPSSAVAASGDTVVVSGIVGSTAVLASIDPFTGALRWVVPFTGAALSAPAVGEGVVVAAAADGTVHGFDLGTGMLLWSIPLRAPLGGPPVIVDGHAVIQENGMYENLDQRDHRTTVLDARTGRFQASWEFAGSFPFSFGFGASGETLLVPGVARSTVIYMLTIVGP